MTGRARREALTRARTRRLELDADRAQRERDIESVTADVLLLLQDRSARLRGLSDTEASIGLAMRSLTQSGVGSRDVAFCCDLDIREVRRLIACTRQSDGAVPASTPPAAQPKSGTDRASPPHTPDPAL